MFKDRREAGRQLAEKLGQYRGENATVIALPRGGVVVGHEVACDLALPLDIVSIRKIGHPSLAEYAIGAVNELGEVIWKEGEMEEIGEEWLGKEKEAEALEAHRRSLIYRKGKEQLDLSGQTVIIVDDGIATGFSMELAIETVKKWWPRKIVVAVPVASYEAASRIRKTVDEFVVLEDPHVFGGAVGAHYEHFEQISDNDVVGLLHTTSALAP